MKTKIKVVIADDHPIFIDGIKTVLSDTPEIEIVGEAKNGLEIIEIVKTTNPDLVLLDIRMPELDGIDAAKILKKQNKELKIIMLTQFGEKGFIRHCQKIGVEGYLLKDCSKNELIETITHINNGGIYFNSVNFKNTKNSDLSQSNSKWHLSKRELEVLKLLAKDFTYIQIAEMLRIELSSIKTYTQRLKNKSGTNTLQGLITWAHKNKVL